MIHLKYFFVANDSEDSQSFPLRSNERDLGCKQNKN